VSRNVNLETTILMINYIRYGLSGWNNVILPQIEYTYKIYMYAVKLIFLFVFIRLIQTNMPHHGRTYLDTYLTVHTAS